MLHLFNNPHKQEDLVLLEAQLKHQHLDSNQPKLQEALVSVLTQLPHLQVKQVLLEQQLEQLSAKLNQQQVEDFSVHQIQTLSDKANLQLEEDSSETNLQQVEVYSEQIQHLPQIQQLSEPAILEEALEPILEVHSEQTPQEEPSETIQEEDSLEIQQVVLEPTTTTLEVPLVPIPETQPEEPSEQITQVEPSEQTQEEPLEPILEEPLEQTLEEPLEPPTTTLELSVPPLPQEVLSELKPEEVFSEQQPQTILSVQIPLSNKTLYSAARTQVSALLKELEVFSEVIKQQISEMHNMHKLVHLDKTKMLVFLDKQTMDLEIHLVQLPKMDNSSVLKVNHHHS